LPSHFARSYNPSEDKFKGQAEKSGHNAAKNIMLMANRFSGSAIMFIIGLVRSTFTHNPEPRQPRR
jgi:hypothetical protein